MPQAWLLAGRATIQTAGLEHVTGPRWLPGGCLLVAPPCASQNTRAPSLEMSTVGLEVKVRDANHPAQHMLCVVQVQRAIEAAENDEIRMVIDLLTH